MAVTIARRGLTNVGVGIYTIPEAARLAQTTSVTLKRWLRGYRFPTKFKGGESAPIFAPQLPEVDGHPALGFLDLVEVLFIKAFREYGVTLPTIRRVAAEAARRWKSDHPFCIKRFRTDGKTIFADVEWEKDDTGLIDLANSQLCFEKVLDPYLHQVDYDTLGAIRWWPLGRNKFVVLDPRYAFGRPIVLPGQVPTEAIFSAVEADQSEAQVAKWFEIPIGAVRAAVAFEKALAA